MMSDKSSKISGIVLLFLFSAFVYWVFTGDADEFANKKTKNETENDIYLSDDIEDEDVDKAMLFLLQVKNKDKYYDKYDIRILSNEGNDMSDVLTSIRISEGAYKFFNVNVTDEYIANPLRIGQGKDLYQCLKTCIERYEAAGGDNCDCSNYFYTY